MDRHDAHICITLFFLLLFYLALSHNMRDLNEQLDDLIALLDERLTRIETVLDERLRESK